ncbi:MAG TPA: universal stress protein [Acidimicrobiales bacterium]|nr:universal stress protein [Acidimicrobiales bacterium]
MTTTTHPKPGTAAEPTAAPRIVVGIDGSEASRAALQWAAGQARLTGARLQVVAAWQFPTYAYTALAPLPSTLDLRTTTEETLRDVIADVLGRSADLDLTHLTKEGDPAHVLLEAAEGADLVVVGSRGHGAFAGLVLGSVSGRVAAHARCPVVVVHAAPGP